MVLPLPGTHTGYSCPRKQAHIQTFKAVTEKDKPLIQIPPVGAGQAAQSPASASEAADTMVQNEGQTSFPPVTEL